MNEQDVQPPEALRRALWRIFRRPTRPVPWVGGGNLPWNEPDFSRRMLREHLDESHGAATRVAAERQMIIDWLWPRLKLKPGQRLLDVTCGPGLYAVELARRGILVTGIDFIPAAVAYARDLAQRQGLAGRCTFVEHDARQMDYRDATFDAALFLLRAAGCLHQGRSPGAPGPDCLVAAAGRPPACRAAGSGPRPQDLLLVVVH
jgi:SAM-dependent methyltransferase